MDTENVTKYAEFLKGISYRDWKILKIGMDRMFQAKIRELEGELKLSDTEMFKVLIRSQFE